MQPEKSSSLADGATTPNSSPPTTPPRFNQLALTEYTANPTPPSERDDYAGRLRDGAPSARLSRKWEIPEEFLLPNGHPDVSISFFFFFFFPQDNHDKARKKKKKKKTLFLLM
jgi:hypothetical protein